MLASPRRQELENVHRAPIRRHKQPSRVRREQKLVRSRGHLGHLGDLLGDEAGSARPPTLAPGSRDPTPAPRHSPAGGQRARQPAGHGIGRDGKPWSRRSRCRRWRCRCCRCAQGPGEKRGRAKAGFTHPTARGKQPTTVGDGAKSKPPPAGLLWTTAPPGKQGDWSLRFKNGAGFNWASACCPPRCQRGDKGKNLG